jgi:gliding motility-associated-like protein
LGKFVFFLLLGFGFFYKSLAQPCFFFLTDSVGCAPFKVRIRTCAPPPVAFNFRWTVPPNFPTITLPSGFTDTGHVYTEVGRYRILQLLGGTDTISRPVRVFNKATKPAFKTTTCGSKLIIEFADSVFSTYSFFPGDGSSNPISVPKGNGKFEYDYSFSNPSTTFFIQIQGAVPQSCNQEFIYDTISMYKNNIPPRADSLIGLANLSEFRSKIRIRADEPYGFEWNEAGIWQKILERIPPKDNLEEASNFQISNLPQKTNLRAFSKNGCNLSFSAPNWTVIWPILSTDNQKITIRWPKIDLSQVSEFKLLRNQQIFKNLLPLTDTVLVDSGDLVCGSTYCYQMLIKKTVAGYDGNLVYISSPICGQAISDKAPEPVQNLTATIENQTVKISGKASALAKTFEIYRRDWEAEQYQKISESNGIPIVDTTAVVNRRNYCYKLAFKDICGNQSRFSDSICPVLLRVEEKNESEKEFFWTPFLGWKGGVKNYELIRFTPFDSPIVLDMGQSQNHRQEGRDPARQSVAYFIRIHANDLVRYPEPSESNKIWLVQNSKLKFPEVFTPNEDQINEVFKCYSLYISDFQMKVFNPWGNLIFFSQDINKGWNGKIDTKPAPAGPYAYWAKGKDEEGNDIEVRGYFNLVR